MQRLSIVTLAVCIPLGLIAFASMNTENGVISGCYHNRTGNLRIIDAALVQCNPDNEIPLSWNEVGPQGPAGDGGPVAMLYVNGDATFLRCYNGITGQSSCAGFSVVRGPFGPGNYNIDFPFDISDRYFVVSVQNGTFGPGIGVNFHIRNAVSLGLYSFESDSSDPVFTDRPVVVIVY